MTISRIGIGIVDDDVRTSRRSVWVVSLAPGLSHFGWAVSIYSYTSLQRRGLVVEIALRRYGFIRLLRGSLMSAALQSLQRALPAPLPWYTQNRRFTLAVFNSATSGFAAPTHTDAITNSIFDGRLIEVTIPPRPLHDPHRHRQAQGATLTKSTR